MQKNIINKMVNKELRGQALSEEKKWEIAVNKSKEKYKSSARRKDKLVAEREYFKDSKEYEEIRGSDFDDYYS